MRPPKEVFCDDPLVEMWKHLRLLEDTSTVSEIMSAEHFQGKSHEVEKNLKNISKQAEQVSFCIRQAEEYFESSNVVSLATKPLLLYYGAASLAMALSLIRKDGEHSLDVSTYFSEIEGVGGLPGVRSRIIALSVGSELRMQAVMATLNGFRPFKTFVERPQLGIAVGGVEGGHVKVASNGRPTAADRAGAAPGRCRG